MQDARCEFAASWSNSKRSKANKSHEEKKNEWKKNPIWTTRGVL